MKVALCDICLSLVEDGELEKAEAATMQVLDRAIDPEGETLINVCKLHYEAVYGADCLLPTKN